MPGPEKPGRDKIDGRDGHPDKIKGVKVLLVEDNPADTRLLKGMLSDAKGALFEVVCADRLSTGLSYLSDGGFDVILLDLILPDSQDLETLRSFSEKALGLPILVLTGLQDESLAIQAVRRGAEDYLVKGNLDSAVLTRAVNFAIERKRIIEVLKNTTRDLEATISELRRSNRKVLEQQKSVIEEERLKVLLQIAGTTAHEINQPLTTILGNIELMKGAGKVPSDLSSFLSKIELAGKRIADIVSKVQDIHNLDTRPYVGDINIINFDQEIDILSVENSDKDFSKISDILAGFDNVNLRRARSAREAFSVIEEDPPDIIFLDYYIQDGNCLEFLRRMHERQKDIPTIVITGKGNEMIASRVIQEGAFDYFPKDMVSEKSLLRSIANTQRKIPAEKRDKAGT